MTMIMAMGKRPRDIALGITVFGATALAVRVIADAATTGWGSGLSIPLAAILFGPLLGGWLARRGHARTTVIVSLGGLTAVLAGTSFTTLTLFGTAATWGLPHLLAGTLLGAVLVHAVAPVLKSRRPAASGLAACWAVAVMGTPLASAWLVAHSTRSVFVWVGLLAFLASLVPAPTGNAVRRPRDPGAGLLPRMLLGVAIVAAAGPLLQPLEPTRVVDLMALYIMLFVLAGYTLYAAGRALGPALAGIAMVGVVLVGTGYQLTAQLQRVKVAGVGEVFAVAGLVGAVAAVAAIRAPRAVRRGLLVLGPAVAVLGMLAALDVGGKPRFALWSIVVIALGVGATLGSGLRDINRTTASLAGGLLVSSVVVGVKLAQGIRVLDVLTGGTPGSVMLHWLVPCALVSAVALVVGYRNWRRGQESATS